MIRRVVSFAALVMAIFLLPSCGKKTQTLNLLVWEGYADPSYVQTFEEQNHCKVSASYMFLAGDETQRAEQSTIDICRNAIVQYQPSYDAAGTSQDLAQALLKMLQQASDRGLGGSSPFRLVEAMTKGL